jgi:Leucine-rich repeat (LRR) protein
VDDPAWQASFRYDLGCGPESRVLDLPAEKAAKMVAEFASGSLRRFRRISVRGLIVLVLMIGAGLGWIVRRAHFQRDAVRAVLKAGGQVDYDLNYDRYPADGVFPWKKLASWKMLIADRIGFDFVYHVAYVQLTGFQTPNETDRQRALAHLPDFGRLGTLNLAGGSVTDSDLAGLESLNHLEHLMLQNTAITDAGLAHLRALTSLQEIFIRNAPIGDQGLAHLQALPSLRHLTLSHTGITDAGMERLKALRGLLTLDLADTKISDAGLRQLAELSDLRRLRLSGTKVTDAGLVHLKGLRNLAKLDLERTAVTPDGVNELENALPGVVIEH